MGKFRASVFSDADERSIDLSGFAPKPPIATTLPSKEQVKAVSEAAQFPSREAPKQLNPAPRKPRRHRTARKSTASPWPPCSRQVRLPLPGRARWGPSSSCSWFRRLSHCCSDSYWSWFWRCGLFYFVFLAVRPGATC